MTEPNITTAVKLGVAQEIDYVNQFTTQLNLLTGLLGVTRKTALDRETVLRVYRWKRAKLAPQVSEGEDIPLTDVERELRRIDPFPLKKYRKQVTAEAVLRVGQQTAINETDARVVSEIQRDIKNDFIKSLTDAPEKLTAENLQGAIAKAWAKARDLFKTYGDVNVIHFVSPYDVAEMLANGTVSNTDNSVFGLTALSNFLGQTVIVFDDLPAGKIITTASQNIQAYYYNMNSEVGSSFNLTTDASGFIGMNHEIVDRNASIETLLMGGVRFFAEVQNGVIETTISPKPEPTPPTPKKATDYESTPKPEPKSKAE